MFCPHAAQEATMHKILDAYTSQDLRQAHLLAQMQSGKSGIFLGLIVRMIHDSIVDRAIVVCGSNETELYDQLVGNWQSVLDLYKCQTFASPSTIRKLTAGVRIYKSTGAQGIKNMPRDVSRCLIIWDESHFAQDIKNLPAKYMLSAGLLVSGTERAHATWVAKDSYFLSVSATPFAAIAAFRHKEFRDTVTHAALIWHEPAACYKGVADLKPYFCESYSIKDNTQQFKELLGTVAPKKYVLVRSLKNLGIVGRICRELGIHYIEYTATTKHSLQNGLNSLNTEPATTTVVGLKGMCRMGKVVPKRYIGLTFEESQTTNTDALLQSFVGRMCGHDTAEDPYPQPMPRIFVPKKFFTTDRDANFTEMDRYIRFVTGEEIVPQRAAHVMPDNSTQAVRTGTYSVVPLVLQVEAAGAAGAAGAAQPVAPWRPTQSCKEQIVQSIYNTLLMHPLADSVQNSFLLEKLSEGGVSRLEFHNICFYDYAMDPATGIAACATHKKAFDDKWTQEGKYFKVYHSGTTTLYVSARTDRAEYETVMEQKNAIPMAEATTLFRCDTIEELALSLAERPAIPVHPVAVIQSQDALRRFVGALNSEGIYTAYIHRSMRNLSEVKDLQKRCKKEGSGNRGKYLPKTYKKDDFPIRITIQIKITIEITVSISGV